jgi:hypothetical protein
MVRTIGKGEQRMTKEDMMKDIDPQLITIGFSQYIISQQTDENLIDYLEGFKTLFWDTIYDKVEDENPPSENEDSLMRKQRVNNIRKETDVVTDRVVNDLSSYVKRLELDVGEIVG